MSCAPKTLPGPNRTPLTAVPSFTLCSCTRGTRFTTICLPCEIYVINFGSYKDLWRSLPLKGIAVSPQPPFYPPRSTLHSRKILSILSLSSDQGPLSRVAFKVLDETSFTTTLNVSRFLFTTFSASFIPEPGLCQGSPRQTPLHGDKNTIKSRFINPLSLCVSYR